MKNVRLNATQNVGSTHLRNARNKELLSQKSVSLLFKGIFLVVLMTAFRSYGSERITIDEVANHYPWDGKVDCVYTLTGLEHNAFYKGIFTIAVKKNGCIIRQAVTNALSVRGGVYTNTFDCTSLFGEGLYPNGSIIADLVKEETGAVGNPIGIMGDVLVIDTQDKSGPYFTWELYDVDLGTFNCEIYKTQKIVLRKIPAGSYYCQPGADKFTGVTQQLATKGFYIGLFPITQRQYECIMGKNPSHFSAERLGDDATRCPVESVDWDSIRGNVEVGETIVATSANSFLQRIVARTGMSGFDLPTEAQWEIACRAGSTAIYGVYWDGTNSVEIVSSTQTTPSNMRNAVWGFSNSGDQTHPVGEKYRGFVHKCGSCVAASTPFLTRKSGTSTRRKL